ncbi:MAG: hypothetical protein WBG08_11450 [Litorimonas sp.]
MTGATDIRPCVSEPTPLMRQYLDIRANVPADTLLLYRMGDFYEVFFEDAERLAAALDIAVTRRGRHNCKPIPMAGIPVHASEAYIGRLVKDGFKVAICEMTECPTKARERDRQAVLRRKVVRIITPNPSEVAGDTGPVSEPATETTAEGEQSLIGGVAPVTLRQRLDAVGARPLTAGPTARQFWGASPKPQSPCDHGLFDEVGRAQTDLCDLIATLDKETSP